MAGTGAVRGGGEKLTTLLAELQASEWITPEEVEKEQLGVLRGVLAHASATVPYYRRRGPYVDLARAGPIDASGWASLPVIDRAEVQEAGRTLRSEKVPPSHLPIGEVTTSGSTGRPLSAARSAVALEYWYAVTLWEQLWHQREFSGTWATIKPDRGVGVPAEGVRFDNWGLPYSLVMQTGPGVLLNVERDVAQQATWLRAVDPDYLLTLPSNLIALARHLDGDGSKLPRLRQVCTYGETLSQEVRDACREALGVTVVDMYSSQELGYLALQCPAGEWYHVASPVVRLEVLDEAGRPCRPGETGRVVVTNLRNPAMPLLRYDVGDYAEVGEACPCGRGMPVLSRVLGRSRNMLVLPDGTRRWPTFGRAWQEIDVIRQFQLVQRSLDHIEARIVGPRPLSADEEARFASILVKRLGHPFTVTFTYLDHIDRRADLKFEDFVSHVGRSGSTDEAPS